MGRAAQQSLHRLRTILGAAALVSICAVLPEKLYANSGLGQNFLQVQSSIAPPSGAKGICQKYYWACSISRKTENLSENDLRIVRTVNNKVNARTQSVSDQAQYKKVEVWALPTTRGGDCEDFALLKKRELIQRGIEPSRLLLATVLDRNRNAHAVLVLRSDSGDLVLDNLTNRIQPWQATRYTFLRMQDPAAPAKWVAVFAGG